MKYTLYILAFTLSLLSCNNDDDTQQNTEPTLEGTWSLVNVYGGFAGVDDDFEPGLITWSFNSDSSEITVINNNTSDVIYSGYPSGVYNYEMITTATDSTLVIETTDLSITTFTNSQLIIDEGFTSDGFLYTLSR